MTPPMSDPTKPPAAPESTPAQESGEIGAGEHPSVPTSQAALMVEALRTANRMSGLLNDLSSALFKIAGETVDDAKWAPLHDLLIRRFSDCSAVHLFIAADNLKMELPLDLRGEPDDEAIYDDD